MEIVILAAGNGSRMEGVEPKVLKEILGIPMIKRVCDSLNNFRKILVVGKDYLKIQEILSGNITYAFQNIPLGTMDAYIQSLPYVGSKEVVVINGDIPFIDKELINDIINYYYKSKVKNLVIGMRLHNPLGYGRIIYDNYLQIIEERNLNETNSDINLVNTGVYVFNVDDVYDYFGKIRIDPTTNEYLITDYINYLGKNHKVDVLIYPENYKLKGVNNIESIKKLEREVKNVSTFKKNY